MPQQQALALDEVLPAVIEDCCSAPLQLAVCCMPVKRQKCTQHQSVFVVADGRIHPDSILGEPFPLIHNNSGHPFSVKPSGVLLSLHGLAGRPDSRLTGGW